MKLGGWALGAGGRGAVVVFAAAMILTGCAGPKALPVLGEVPQFQLVSETGGLFDSHALDGHIWVADFFFTTCDGPCPMMSSQMHLLQTETAAEMPDVKLISFTVDPAHDTPPILADYARHFKQDPARWTFLTGAQEKLNDIGLAAFKLNGVDGSLGHSTRFTLVDRRRRIRGYYISSEGSLVRNLMRDIRRLEREKS